MSIERPWGALAVVFAILALSMAALVVAAQPPDPRVPHALEVDTMVPRPERLQTLEVAPLERPQVDARTEEFMQILVMGWPHFFVAELEVDMRMAMARYRQEFLVAGRYVEFAQVLERMRRAASLLRSASAHLPAPAGRAFLRRVGEIEDVLPFLVDARYQLDALDAADELSAELVRLRPDNADAHATRALVLDAAGAEGRLDAEALRHHIVRALTLAPDYSGFGATAAQMRESLRRLDERFGPAPRRVDPTPSSDGTPGALDDRARRRVESVGRRVGANVRVAIGLAARALVGAERPPSTATEPAPDDAPGDDVGSAGTGEPTSDDAATQP